jgi:benzoate membrane transport protein
MRLSLLASALVAALVGYGSTIALLLAAAAALGASPAETTSWITAVCLLKAAGSLGLSLWSRVPVVLAWSTPGAALVAATSGLTMAEAAGAFLIAGLLTAATGLVRPLGRAVAAIPDAVAAGMLAGVLLPFCLKLPGAAAAQPGIVLPMIAVFALIRLRNPALAVLGALAAGVALAFLTGTAAPLGGWSAPGLTWIAPAVRWEVAAGLALPLYLVTMASQNLPGFATLRAHGYDPPVAPALVVTGGLSALGAFAGAHPVSMAAITAAMVMGPDTHPDPGQRWKAAIPYAAVWTGLAALGPLVIALLAALPPDLVAAVVGLALLGTFTGAAGTAFATPALRFPAGVTLAVTAAGVAVWGVGAAFWGLLAGLAFAGLDRLARR